MNMKKAINPSDWLPDWKEKAEYPASEDTAPDQWAWEFLRRNSEYQKDYEIYCQYSRQEDYEKIRELDDKYYLENLIPPDNHDPFSRPGPYGWNMPKVRLKPWVAWGTASGEWEIDNIFTAELTPSQFGVVFDHALPWRPQLEEVERYFSAHRYKPIFEELPIIEALPKGAVLSVVEASGKRNLAGSKPRFSKFQDYLRVLDGNSTGATHLEIAVEIFPVEMKNGGDDYARNFVSKNLRQASLLRDGGYQDILFVSL